MGRVEPRRAAEERDGRAVEAGDATVDRRVDDGRSDRIDQERAVASFLLRERFGGARLSDDA